MSTQNLVSAAISAATKTQIQTKINNIETALPFLISLTNDERKGGIKLGDKTVAFVEKVIAYADSNPTLVPPFLDLTEIKKDYALQKDLIAIQQWLGGLIQKLEDTSIEAGSEALAASLSFYQSVKVAAEKDVPGARSVYEDLQTRFPGRKSKKTPLNPATDTPAS